MSDFEEDAPMSGVEEEIQIERKKVKPAKKQQKKSTAPESHVVLLKQAIISRDSEKFFTVVRNLHPDMQSKRLTIKELDANMILPTLNYINDLFRDDKLRERVTYLRDFGNMIGFLEQVLEIHNGYLSTIQNLHKHLSGLVDFAEKQTSNINKLVQLEGRLSVLKTRLDSNRDTVKFQDQPPLVYYKEEGRGMNKARDLYEASGTSDDE